MKIAVVGGGPAGSYVSCLLAKKGAKVLLFDHKIPWEKACGGAITWKGIKTFPFLQKTALNPFKASELEFISPNNKNQTIHMDNPIYIYSRKELGLYLLRMAQKAGVQHLRERVIKIVSNGTGWQIITAQKTYKAALLIGADGGQSIVRRLLWKKPDKKSLCLAFSALAQGDFGSKIIIKFVKGLRGYIWIFPRKQATSIGICSSFPFLQPLKLQKILTQFLDDRFNSSFGEIKFASVLIPIFSDARLENTKIAGEKWALIGDAAGFADPITGEGIYYALKSAQLLVESFKRASFLEYPELLKEDFLPQLAKVYQIKDKFYTLAFLERMIFSLIYCPSVRRVLTQVIDGDIGYLELKRRLLSVLPRAVGEMIITALSHFISFK